MAQRRNRRSGVEDRWTKTVRDSNRNLQTVPSATNGKGLRWRARYVDEDGQERAKGFRTKADAQRWLNGVISAQETGSYVDPKLGKVTFSSFYKEWSTRQVWVSSTRHVMDQTARSVTFGDIDLADLRPSQIEAWINAMQDAELEPTTIRTRYTNARTVIRAAVRDRIMARDVVSQIKLPRTRKASAAMTIPTPEQVGNALRTSDGWFTAFIAACLFAGLRRAEASALQVGDIDFLRKELRVVRQVQWTDDGRMEIRGPKYGSERTVYISDQLVTMLSEHVRLYLPGNEPQRWLFPGRMNADRSRSDSRSGLAGLTGQDRYRASATRRSSLLRVGVDRVGLRCGHRAARARPLIGCTNTLDLFTPMARRERPHSQGRGGAH